ncbi:SWIM zinc finger family protein [Streptomyces sp. NPDC001312]|uniref:SWIM zinc finger family protein n=1 Tax=Streptomyces sp. NPDC001312 TaxID=3364561 RepID=UPI00368FC33D
MPPTPVLSAEDFSTTAIPTAAWAAASQAALTRTQEDASESVLTTSVTSVTPSDGSSSRTSQEATPVVPSDALLVGTEEWASAGAPDGAWTVTGEGAPVGTPGAPSAATRDGAPAGAPGAPTAATRHGASAGTPAGGPSAATGKGASAGAPDASSAATWDGASAGAPDVSSGTTRQGASADTQFGPSAGTPDGVSAVMGESASAGTPGAPSAATRDGVSAGTPDAPSTAGEGTSTGTPGAPSTGTPEAASDGRRAYGRRTSPSSAGAGSGSAAFSPARAGAEPPVPPRVPRTMASPRRDGELRRTFPAFPARAVEGERFAETWWGDAWVDALEEGALDAARLARGRGYAQTGHVDAVTVTPGLVLAYVQGSRPRPYRVQVRLRTLDDADWDRFLDAVAERPGHIAALLDKEMPQSLADCGVPLLPGPGDLEPHCSCPDRGHPCKHAAALCYQTARLLDADPFVLLLLRGRGERELLDALSRLNATRAARAAQEREPEPFPGVRAGEALAERRRLPLPAPLPAPPHPEQPPVYPAAPGGPDPFALDQLATDAAARAHALLTTGRDPVGGLTLWQDAVRLAAARPGSGLTAATRSLYASLASATGRGTAELARAVAAWRQGGLEGLAVLEEPWDPPAGRFDRARPLLLAADLPAFRPRRNRLTHPRGHLQLRLGRDGLWYAYESEPDRDDWWPRGTPDLDPVGALTGLGAPGAL